MGFYLCRTNAYNHRGHRWQPRHAHHLSCIWFPDVPKTRISCYPPSAPNEQQPQYSVISTRVPGTIHQIPCYQILPGCISILLRPHLTVMRPHPPSPDANSHRRRSSNRRAARYTCSTFSASCGGLARGLASFGSWPFAGQQGNRAVFMLRLNSSS